MEKKNCSCLFDCFSGMTDRQVIVVTCLPRFECISDFKIMGGTVHCEHSLLTGQPVGRWAEMKLWREEEAAVLWLCVRGPRVWEWRQTRVEGSYSLLKALHKSKWLTWRTHDAGILHTCIHIHTRAHLHMDMQILVCPYTNTFVLYLSHTHMCVRVHSCKTKLAVSYSQAVETDLPQCLHCLTRGEEYRKRCSTVQRGDLPSVENQWRKISTHTDVAVVQVHLLHACCTNAEQLHIFRDIQAEEMQGLRKATYKTYDNSFC